MYVSLGFQFFGEVKVIFNEYYAMRLKNWIIWYRQAGWKGDNGFAHSHEHILFFIKDGVPAFELVKFGRHIKEKRLEAGYSTVDSLMEAMGLYTLINRKTGISGYYSGAGFVESGKKNPSLQELVRLNQLLDLDIKYQVDMSNIDMKRFGVFFNKVDVCDDVWLNPKAETNRLGHPTQKPISLYGRMINASSAENDLILDCFSGLGSSCVAAKMLGRRYIGIDISEKYCQIARQRLEAIDTGVPVKEQKAGQLALFKDK